MEWGGDREVLLRLDRSLVRSKLDYGSIVYGAACKSLLVAGGDTVVADGLNKLCAAVKEATSRPPEVPDLGRLTVALERLAENSGLMVDYLRRLTHVLERPPPPPPAHFSSGKDNRGPRHNPSSSSSSSSRK